jgi:hypothetical protein
MPITTIIILAAIVVAFALFGVVLAWGEMQTPDISIATNSAPAKPRRPPIRCA